MSEPPKKIYLQWVGLDKRDFAALTDDEKSKRPLKGGITWYEDKIYDTDAEYVLRPKRRRTPR